MDKLKILLVLSMSVIFYSCDIKKREDLIEKSKYEQILEKEKIKVGYISYPPSFIVKPNGAKSGIFYETMEKIGENLGLEIEYAEEVTWDGMIESLRTGKVDMIVTGIWPTSQRGKFADFANPLFYSLVKAYVKNGNTKFDNNISLVNNENVIISTIDGEMTSIIANLDFPKAKTLEVTQLSGVSQTLLEVQTNKADITFVEPAIALEFLDKNPNSIQEVKGIEPLRIFPNAMMLPKGSTEFRTTLNIAIDELINNGFIDNVIAKYEKFPNSYSKVLKPYNQTK